MDYTLAGMLSGAISCLVLLGGKHLNDRIFAGVSIGIAVLFPLLMRDPLVGMVMLINNGTQTSHIPNKPAIMHSKGM